MQIGIVGAGIMGRLLAFSLIEAGHTVSLFDQDNEQAYLSCSRVAAGLLTPLSELDKSENIIYQLGIDALQYHWPVIIRSMTETIYFQTNGSIVLSHPKDLLALQHYLALIQDKISSQLIYQRLDKQALLTFEPALSKFDTAYFFSNEGHVDAQAVMHALRTYFHDKKIVWHTDTVISQILPHVIFTSTNTYEVDIAIDCRGMGAKNSWKDLQGVRGELIWLYAPTVKIKRPIRFIHPRYTLYVVPRPGDIYLVGATEIYSDDTSEVSVKSALELLSMSYYLHPGFAEANIINMMTQCRPTLLSHLPTIKYKEGFIAINGLYRHGFLIAPSLAADIVRGINQLPNHEISSCLHYPQLWECM